MRCMACGAEMILMNVVQDETMPVPGFEQRTFMCSGCYDVERRLAFIPPDERRQDPIQEPIQVPLPVHAAPPLVPAESAHEDTMAAPVPGLLRRVVAKLRRRESRP
jgi:hypothetical protein